MIGHGVHIQQSVCMIGGVMCLQFPNLEYRCNFLYCIRYLVVPCTRSLISSRSQEGFFFVAPGCNQLLFSFFFNSFIQITTILATAKLKEYWLGGGRGGAGCTDVPACTWKAQNSCSSAQCHANSQIGAQQ